MSLNLQTTTAVIDENGVLRGLEPLLNARGETVQIVIIRLEKETGPESEYDDSELTPEQWHYGVSRLMAANVEHDSEEDIYSLEDGKPYDASQD